MPDSPDYEPSSEPSDGESVEPPSSSPAPPPRHPAEPVLPQRSADERDLGWGDGPSGYDDDWYLAERPPHHG